MARKKRTLQEIYDLIEKSETIIRIEQAKISALSKEKYLLTQGAGRVGSSEDDGHRQEWPHEIRI